MRNQASNELRIFQEFASIAPIAIDPETIQKREPPEPDMWCHSIDDGDLRFELTEAIDSSIAQAVYGSTQLDNLMRKQFELLSSDIKQKLINACIRINYDTNITLNKKKSLLTAVLDYLKYLPKKADGEFHPEINGIESVEIIRCDIVGPSFNFNTTTSFFGSPIIQCLREKFAKSYSFEEDIHLLVYLDLQPELPVVTWLPEAIDYVRANIKMSSFRKVWFYSMTTKKIIGAHP